MLYRALHSATAVVGTTLIMVSLEKYAGSALFSIFGLLVLIAMVVCGMWFYRLYNTRGFHLADFEKLSAAAMFLVRETASIRQDIESDYSSDLEARMLNMARINAAEEIDTGIRIALNAWEDIMQPDEGNAHDEEGGIGAGTLDSKGQKKKRERRKSQVRHAIGRMRRKCVQGIEERRDLSPTLQIMHLEVLSR